MLGQGVRLPLLRCRQVLRLTESRLRRLPPWEGVIDVNVYLLWNREQKLTQAESAFLSRFEQMLMTTDLSERL